MTKHARRVLELGVGLALALTIVLTVCADWHQRTAAQVRADTLRLHILANSDTLDDQLLKLQVRDAVLNSLQSDLNKIADVNEARAYLQARLPQIQAVANSVLEATGCDCEAVVTLCKEAFDTRYYDTFTLPAGIYEALRITIGEGEGHNWWCVAFPSLCLSATSEEFASRAAGAGFPDSLTGALDGEEKYEMRFFLLDALGELEKILFAG